MAAQDIAAALQRAQALLRRRPEAGLDDDSTATARWQGGLRILASHASGATLPTDMPSALGGSGDQVSPGWLFRAALATCAATRIAMAAAEAGIALSDLEVSAHSRSDLRGLLGLAGADGTAISAAPRDLQLKVRIAAAGVPAERLRALVRDCQDLAPVGVAVRDAQQVALVIAVDESRADAA